MSHRVAVVVATAVVAFSLVTSGCGLLSGSGGRADGTSVDRVAEGGEVLQRIELDLPCFACMFGGEDGTTLFMLVADWRLHEGFEDNSRRLTTGPRTGKILTAAAAVPSVGWP